MTHFRPLGHLIDHYGEGASVHIPVPPLDGQEVLALLLSHIGHRVHVGLELLVRQLFHWIASVRDHGHRQKAVTYEQGVKWLLVNLLTVMGFARMQSSSSSSSSSSSPSSSSSSS